MLDPVFYSCWRLGSPICFVVDHATVYLSDCVQNAKFGYCAEYGVVRIIVVK